MAVVPLDSRQASITRLLLSEERPATVEAIASDLEVQVGASRPTVRRDLRAAEAWLEGHHLHLQRLLGVGIAVRGSELDIRKGLLSLVLEAVPADHLLAEMSKPN